MTTSSTAYDYLLQQVAAEAYIDASDLGIDSRLIAALIRGNSKEGHEPRGNTKLTEVQARELLSRFEVVLQNPSDGSGFSCTLLRERATGTYTLSFRSTEYQNQSNGGDWERDGLHGADGEIFKYGLAFAQIHSMEEMYAHLRRGERSVGVDDSSQTIWQADSRLSDFLDPTLKINVTGYSLGGHLATVFTELHSANVAQAITFNAPGRGRVANDDLQSALSYFELVLRNPDAAPRPLGGATSPEVVAYAAAKAAVGPLNSTSLYSDPRYRWAVLATRDAWGTASIHVTGSEERSAFPHSLITQVYGRATHDDREYVANQGIHGPELPIFVEDQPDWVGDGGFLNYGGDYGVTHSITLLGDSLALMRVFQQIAPELDVETASAIFAASSNSRAKGDIVVEGSESEGPSLENALDSLRHLFLGPHVLPTPSGNALRSFASDEFRTPFFANLKALEKVVAENGGTLTVVPLAGVPPADLLAFCQGFSGIAARYALVTGAPYMVLGDASLFEPHNENGELDLFDPATGRGMLTESYLADRALYVFRLLQRNLENLAATASDPILDASVHGRQILSDTATATEIFVGPEIATDRTAIRFGGEGPDKLSGLSGDDRLYGGSGADLLVGSVGADRLEGGSGVDLLVGGAGADVLDGRDRAPGDTLDGGAGCDTFFADWGDIVIDEAGSANCGTIYVGPGAMELIDGFRTEGERFFTAANGVKYWERSDGAISAFGPDGAAALLIAPPGTTVPGTGAEGSTIISGRPDLGIRLVTERTDSLNRSIGGLNNSILALWDRARTWRPFADPLALDLDGDGFETLGNASGEMVLFDHSGIGVRNGTGWLTGGDAWVVLDRDGDGLVTSGEELFGIDTPMPGGGKGADGFAALAPLDTNQDGSVDAADAPLDAWQVAQDLDDDGLTLPTELGGASFADLKLWRDENLNGFSEPFELQSLSDAGIVRINVDAAADVRTLPGGNRLLLSATFEKADGSTGTAGALDLVRETFHRDYLTPPSAAPEGNALPNITGSGQVRDLQEAAAESAGLLAALHAAVAAPDREAQIVAVPSLVDEWASSSSMQTGTEAAAARPDQAILYYQFNDLSLDLPWSAANGSIELPATMDANWFADQQSPEYRERLRKIEILERFTGQTFADLSRLSAGTVFTATGHALRTIQVGIGADNWRLLEQAYAALEESAYLSIAVQSRLEPYVSAALRGNGGVGFGDVESLFSARHDADAIGAIGDLADLARAAGAELVERGWVGLPFMLEAWLREAQADPDLASQLGSLGVAFRDWHSLDGTGQGDILLGSDWLPPSGSGIRLTDGGIGNDLIFGGDAGESTVSDGPGRDLVMGGPEINRYKGGAGHDIYLFGRGSGRDYLQPDSASGTTLPLDRDVLQFLPGVLPEDVIVRRATNPFAQFDAIEFRIQGTEDVFTDLGFAHQDTTENDRRLLDEVRFADGTVWSVAAIRQRLLEGDDSSEGVSTVVPGLRGFNDRDDVISGRGGDDGLIGLGGNDTLLGGDGADMLEGGHGNDVLDGGPGDDALYGGFGVDAYVLARGGGTDQIFNGNFITWAGTNDFPDLDVVRVAEGIGQDEVLLQRQSSRLRILLADGSAQLLDFGNPLNPHYQPSDGHAPSIGRIEFADGSFWNASEIRARSLLGATEGADVIVGFTGSGDSLHGLAGEDTLAGLGGDDVLDGGRGIDRLEGGLGADIYVWRRGDGADVIVEDASDGIRSTLLLPDASLAQLTWSGAERELVIAGESLHIDGSPALWTVAFADGTSIGLDLVPAAAPNTPPPSPGPAPGPDSGAGSEPVTVANLGAGGSPPGPPTGLPPGAPPPPPGIPGVIAQGEPKPEPVAAAEEDVPVTEPSTTAGDPMSNASPRVPLVVDASTSNLVQVPTSDVPVGIPLDPLYREMTRRFDILLQVGRANLSERYSEAVREFEERRRQREAPPEPPPPTEEEIMAHNRAMHAWHDRNPGFADVDGVEQDGVWAPGWGGGANERSFDDLLNLGNAPNLMNPNALPRLGGAARSPRLSEGLRDLR